MLLQLQQAANDCDFQRNSIPSGEKKKKNHCRYNRKPDRPRAEGGKPARCDRKLEELYGGTLKKPLYWSWRVVRVKALQHQEDCANGAGKTGAFNVLKSVDTRQRPFK